MIHADRTFLQHGKLEAPMKGGRLVVDEPVDLPEGTVIELLSLDPPRIFFRQAKVASG